MQLSFIINYFIRLEAIAVDSELQEKSLAELGHVAKLLHNGCQEASDLYQQLLSGNELLNLY